MKDKSSSLDLNQPNKFINIYNLSSDKIITKTPFSDNRLISTVIQPDQQQPNAISKYQKFNKESSHLSSFEEINTTNDSNSSSNILSKNFSIYNPNSYSIQYLVKDSTNLIHERDYYTKTFEKNNNLIIKQSDNKKDSCSFLETREIVDSKNFQQINSHINNEPKDNAVNNNPLQNNLILFNRAQNYKDSIFTFVPNIPLSFHHCYQNNLNSSDIVIPNPNSLSNCHALSTNKIQTKIGIANFNNSFLPPSHFENVGNEMICGNTSMKISQYYFSDHSNQFEDKKKTCLSNDSILSKSFDENQNDARHIINTYKKFDGEIQVELLSNPQDQKFSPPQVSPSHYLPHRLFSKSLTLSSPNQFQNLTTNSSLLQASSESVYNVDPFLTFHRDYSSSPPSHYYNDLPITNSNLALERTEESTFQPNFFAYSQNLTSIEENSQCISKNPQIMNYISKHHENLISSKFSSSTPTFNVNDNIPFNNFLSLQNSQSTSFSHIISNAQSTPLQKKVIENTHKKNYYKAKTKAKEKPKINKMASSSKSTSNNLLKKQIQFSHDYYESSANELLLSKNINSKNENIIDKDFKPSKSLRKNRFTLTSKNTSTNVTSASNSEFSYPNVYKENCQIKIEKPTFDNKDINAANNSNNNSTFTNANYFSLPKQVLDNSQIISNTNPKFKKFPLAIKSPKQIKLSAPIENTNIEQQDKSIPNHVISLTNFSQEKQMDNCTNFHDTISKANSYHNHIIPQTNLGCNEQSLILSSQETDYNNMLNKTTSVYSDFANSYCTKLNSLATKEHIFVNPLHNQQLLDSVPYSSTSFSQINNDCSFNAAIKNDSLFACTHNSDLVSNSNNSSFVPSFACFPFSSPSPQSAHFSDLSEFRTIKFTNAIKSSPIKGIYYDSNKRLWRVQWWVEKGSKRISRSFSITDNGFWLAKAKAALWSLSEESRKLIINDSNYLKSLLDEPQIVTFALENYYHQEKFKSKKLTGKKGTQGSNDISNKKKVLNIPLEKIYSIIDHYKLYLQNFLSVKKDNNYLIDSNSFQLACNAYNSELATKSTENDDLDINSQSLTSTTINPFNNNNNNNSIQNYNCYSNYIPYNVNFSSSEYNNAIQPKIIDNRDYVNNFIDPNDNSSISSMHLSSHVNLFKNNLNIPINSTVSSPSSFDLPCDNICLSHSLHTSISQTYSIQKLTTMPTNTYKPIFINSNCQNSINEIYQNNYLHNNSNTVINNININNSFSIQKDINNYNHCDFFKKSCTCFQKN